MGQKRSLSNTCRGVIPCSILTQALQRFSCTKRSTQTVLVFSSLESFWLLPCLNGRGETPGLLGYPWGAKGQTVPSKLPVTSSRLVILSLSGYLSSLGTHLQADLPCCQQKGPSGALSRTGWGCAAVEVPLLQPRFPSLGTSQGPCPSLSPSISRAPGSHWPSFPPLLPLIH